MKKKFLKKVSKIILLRLIILLVMELIMLVPIVGIISIPLLFIFHIDSKTVEFVLGLSTVVFIYLSMFLLPRIIDVNQNEGRLINFLKKNSLLIKKFGGPIDKKILSIYFYIIHFFNRDLKEKYKEYLTSKPFYIKKKDKVILLPNQKSFRRRYFKHMITALRDGWIISANRYFWITVFGQKLKFYNHIYA